MIQRCYNGVRFLDGAGPSPRNVQRLDHFARPYILRCMQNGMRVDLSHFERMEKLLQEDKERLTDEVADMAGYRLNLDSGDQVSELLFKRLRLKQAHPKMTKGGDRESVENEVLVAIQHDHPVVPKLLEFKEVSKLLGTYVRPMPRLAVKVGHGHYRMFPKLGDTRVPSGRLNCKDPNLLAMPNRTKRGRQVCEGFICEDGYVFLSVDESQIEPRTVAHRSKDRNLAHVYHTQQDIYSDFAITAFRLEDNRYEDTAGWHYPSVDKKRHRFPAKTCTLASIYDVTGSGLLEQMPIVCKHCYAEVGLHDAAACPHGRFVALWTEQSCDGLIAAFYDRYPGILTMRKRDHARARKHGFVWDDWGRILHTAGVRSSLEWVVGATLRELGNFPIQSTAQGTVKLAMAEVDDIITSTGLEELCKPVLQIHDELLFEVHESVVEDVAGMVCSVFEGCVKFDVPITAGWAKSENWGKLQK